MAVIINAIISGKSQVESRRNWDVCYCSVCHRQFDEAVEGGIIVYKDNTIGSYCGKCFEAARVDSINKQNKNSIYESALDASGVGCTTKHVNVQFINVKKPKEENTMSTNVINSIGNVSNVSKRLNKCFECGKRFNNDELLPTYTDECVCVKCSCQKMWFVCQACGCYFPEDIWETAIVNEEEGIYYCPNCELSHRAETMVHNYSYKPDAIFHGNDSKLYFGMEFECDCGNNDDSIDNKQSLIKELHTISSNENYFYMKNDNSINGVEVVSHPFTYNEMMNTYPVEAICEAMESNGYYNPDGKAGIHIHMSKAAAGDTKEAQDAFGVKVAILVAVHWEQLLKLANRTKTNYCQFPACQVSEDASDEEIINAFMKTTDNHYCAVNTQNKSTVELRIFDSIACAKHVRMFIEATDDIAEYALTHTIRECMYSTFEEIFEGTSNKLLHDVVEEILLMDEEELYVERSYDKNIVSDEDVLRERMEERYNDMMMDRYA